MKSILPACILATSFLAAAPAISAAPNPSSLTALFLAERPAGNGCLFGETGLGHDDGMDQGGQDEATDGSGEPGEDACPRPAAIG